MKGINEQTYSVEGYGQRSDPLVEYHLEEERLHNIKSPYFDHNEHNENFSIRRVVPNK